MGSDRIREHSQPYRDLLERRAFSGRGILVGDLVATAYNTDDLFDNGLAVDIERQETA